MSTLQKNSFEGGLYGTLIISKYSQRKNYLAFLALMLSTKIESDGSVAVAIYPEAMITSIKMPSRVPPTI